VTDIPGREAIIAKTKGFKFMSELRKLPGGGRSAMLRHGIARGKFSLENAMISRSISVITLIFAILSGAFTWASGEPNFDHLTEADRKVFQERFVKEIWPLLERGGKNGCVGCHTNKGNSLKFTGKADKDFRMLVKDGFFIPGDSGSILSRVTSKAPRSRMPPPGKGEPWAKSEVEVLEKFVADMAKKQQKR
jgi:hypothetical protein